MHYKHDGFDHGAPVAGAGYYGTPYVDAGYCGTPYVGGVANNWFPLIVVLFILLIIIGAVCYGTW
ncbi:YjcZ family sporulation protein [Mesobacillus harenae]|uniref:YjcZ family sporulation protein n=1 Tax=Mesobacillus harenae TaxID=2213203 RepID=UPI0018D7DDC2|nr:YjcZ family sporulation protein [Mesobacillus harenae]